MFPRTILSKLEQHMTVSVLHGVDVSCVMRNVFVHMQKTGANQLSAFALAI